MIKRTRYLVGGGKITTEEISEDEFRKMHPEAIEIKTIDDIKKLDKILDDFDGQETLL